MCLLRIQLDQIQFELLSMPVNFLIFLNLSKLNYKNHFLESIPL